MFTNIYYCFCRNTQRFVNDQPTNRTPLLAGAPKQFRGSILGGTVVSDQPQMSVSVSVEQLHPQNGSQARSKPRKISVGFTIVKTVDKKLQDQSRVYNDYYRRYQEAQALYHDLCSAFGEENVGETVESTFKLIAEKTHDCLSVNISHSPAGSRVEFDPQEIPANISVYLNKANALSKLSREILDRGPKLINSVQLLLKDEADLRRDVLAASMGPEGPGAMKICLGGISELRRVPGFVEEILLRAKKHKKRLQKALRYLIREVDLSQMSDITGNVAKEAQPPSNGTSSSSGEENPVKPPTISSAEQKMSEILVKPITVGAEEQTPH